MSSESSSLSASSADLQAMLASSGAMLTGHFVLTSGRHSPVYIEKFRILERPELLAAFCAAIADRFRSTEIDLVAGPTTGGIIVAFEVARQLGCKAVYVESEGGRRRLRRGGEVAPGSKVLVVDDVLTTGKSIFEVIEVIREAGGIPLAVGVLIDRAEGSLNFGMPAFAATSVDAQSFDPADVPDWLAAIPEIKPGTRPTA